jgi:hypothetical protein
MPVLGLLQLVAVAKHVVVILDVILVDPAADTLNRYIQ